MKFTNFLFIPLQSLLNISSNDKINYVNILLMLLSLGLSIVLPFELLLISYAVLGPLHYLTEISWLRDRNYFLKNKADKILVFLAIIFLLLGCTAVFPTSYFNFFQQWNLMVLYLTFGGCLILVLTSNISMRILAFLSLIVCSLIFLVSDMASILLVIYLTTLIHVYVFTGAFILSGSIKNKSVSGYMSFIIFILCPIICFIVSPGLSQVASAWSQQSYTTTFTILNQVTVDKFFGISNLTEIFKNPVSILVTRFMAFAYTYHYLNWFSKTSVIKWHKISKKRFVFILIFWVASLTLYKINYLLAYKWLFVLSYIHVLLEFPLNHHSFIHITKSLKIKKSNKFV